MEMASSKSSSGVCDVGSASSMVRWMLAVSGYSVTRRESVRADCFHAILRRGSPGWYWRSAK